MDSNNETKPVNTTRVFVYGTLKEGHGNYRWYLDGNPAVRKLGRCLIRGDYRMFSNGAFPMVTEGGNTNRKADILGEVYEVDEETLLALDALEGHPDWYCRKKVETPWKKAWVYLMPYEPDRFDHEAEVTSGCFHMTTEEAEWLNGDREAQAV